MRWFKKVRELSSQVGMTQRHTQVLGCPSRDVFRFSPAHHTEVVRDFVLGEVLPTPFARWSNPWRSWSSLFLSSSMIVLTVASVMGGLLRRSSAAPQPSSSSRLRVLR